MPPETTPVALITGASKGIGLAIADTLASLGYNMALSGRSPQALDTLAKRLGAQYPTQQFMPIVADLSQPMFACAALIDSTVTRLGRLDVLINNAGVAGRIALLTEIEDRDIHDTLMVNLLAPTLLAKHAMAHMVQRPDGGVIVNVSSIAGKTAFPFWSVYCASKFGLTALSEAIGQEQRSNNIRVVTLHPGAVDTPIWDGIDTAANRGPMLQPATVAQAVRFALTQPPGVWVSDITVQPLHSVL
jgi:NADP-dependent 3-hydroxy acid dehydrogenase YdfG